MELNEFITKVFIELDKGVKNAQTLLGDDPNGTVINRTYSQKTGANPDDALHNRDDCPVELSAIVCVSDNKIKIRELGIDKILKAGRNTNSQERNSSEMSVKFTINVSFPAHKLDYNKYSIK